MKQEALAIALGVSQQSVPTLENRESIEDDKLLKVAKALAANAEAIKTFSEECVMTYINTLYDNSSAGNGVFESSYNCTFNPLDKVVELYERLLEVEREKIEILNRKQIKLLLQLYFDFYFLALSQIALARFIEHNLNY